MGTFASRFFAVTVLGILPGLHGTAVAQDFPSRPIHIMVPFTPGGGCDSQVRLISQRLSEELKQPIVVENKNMGANGTIGLASLSRMPADGYNLVCVSTGSLLITPMLSKNAGFKLSDVVAVAPLSRQPMIMIVPGASPIKSVQELIAAAKAKDANVSYASAGVGSQAHMSGEIFNSIAGTNFTHIPYKGGGSVFQSLLTNEVTVGYAPASGGQGLFKAGKLRPLAILSSTRSPFLPEVPTMKEAGPQHMELIAWFGLMAPAGTPSATSSLIQEKVAKILSEPGIKAKFDEMVAEPWTGSSDDFMAAIRRDHAMYEQVIRERDIKAE